MMREIDEDEWYEAMIKYIKNKIEPINKLKKYVCEDNQNFRIQKNEDEEIGLYKIFPEDEGESPYLQQIFR